MENIPEEALKIVKEFEGLRLKAYLCAGGKWTVGYGHTKGVDEGMEITEEQAEAFLKEDLQAAVRAVDRNVDVPLNTNQFSALLSFVFNVGVGNFSKSTLLRLLNRGWYEQVPAQLSRWNRANGEILGGLSRRRKAEGHLWNREAA